MRHDLDGCRRDHTCTYTGRVAPRRRPSTDPEAVYTVFQACYSGMSDQPEPCSNPRACTVGEETGAIYGVRRNGVYIGTACLTAGDSKVFTPPIAVMVAKRFKALEWPKSTADRPARGRQDAGQLRDDLLHDQQPADVEDRDPAGQTGGDRGNAHVLHLALRGRDEHRPRAVPAIRTPTQDVVHTYTGLDPVEPSVDTVYSGRFRVNGGEWENIEETVTVAGEARRPRDPGGDARTGDRPGGVEASA